MARRASRCAECGELLDPVLPDCPHCGAPADDEAPSAAEAAKQATAAQRARRAKLPIPWGLFIVLGLYFGGVYAYVQVEYYSSPQYAAARHIRAAAQLLGDDSGRTARVPDLHEALDHYLQALNSVPTDAFVHDQVEVVVRRLKERGERLSVDTQRKVDALSALYRQDYESKTSLLPIGARDIWDVDEVVNMPAKIMRSSAIGGLFIFAFWLYIAWQNGKRVRRIDEEKDESARAELRELGAHRRGLKNVTGQQPAARRKKG